MKKLTYIILIFTLTFLPLMCWANVGSNYIEQFGITWTFDKNISLDGAGDTYRYGQFVNGDYWVVGPVNIVQISPRSIEEADGRIRNGSMLNHIPTNGPRYQGFDNAMRAPAWNPYNASYNVAYNVSAENLLTIAVPASLISTISLAEEGANPVQTKTAVILTILNEAPPANSFRPTYAGTDKTIIANKNDIDYSVLKSIPLVGDNIPSSGQYNSWFALPWLELGPQGVASMRHPSDNMPWYGREIAARVGAAGLILNSSLSNEEKETLLIGFLQYGLDLYGLVQQDHTTGYFIGDGGHGYGRKLPLVFAATVLDNDDIRAVIAKTGDYIYNGGHGPTNPPADYIHFGEDHTTIYFTQDYYDLNLYEYKSDRITPAEPDDLDTVWLYYYDTGGVNTNLHRDYPDAYYTVEDYNLPVYVKSAEAGQRRWISRRFDASYRSMGQSLQGLVLSAQIMGLKSLWNHDSLFDYTDRFTSWAFSVYPSQDGDGLPTDHRVFWSYFARDMWYTYRADYGPVWPDTGTQQLTEIEQYGITWTFDKEYECGQFVNGDWWVKGPVTVTNITPGWDGEKHWSTKNPMPIPRNQQEKVTVPVTLDINTSLISTVSWIIGEPGCPDLINGVPRPALKKAAVLTVVAENPGSNAFRPPYAGNDKPIYYISQLKKHMLPQLPLVSHTPNIQEVADRFERVWIDYFAHHGDGTQYTSPSENMPNYGTTYSRYVSEATLLLMLDETELINQQGQNKDLLLMRIVQLGIDLYEVVENGGYWWPGGAVNTGRKWPILFTGLMLDHEGMKNIGIRSQTMPFHGFQEDGQTFFIAPKHVYSQPYALKYTYAQYTTGSVNVVQGSNIVEGINTAWLSTSATYYFGIPGDDQANKVDGKAYKIKQIIDNTYLELEMVYTGETANNKEYKIGRYLYYGHGGHNYRDFIEYTEEHLNMPEWGSQPEELPDFNGFDWNAPYRGLNGHSFPGFVLAAHIMDQKQAWNHDALFDYVDRWVDEMTPYTGSQPVHEGLYVYGSDFIMDMWIAYRGYKYVEPDPENSDDPQDPDDTENPDDTGTEPMADPIPEVFNLAIHNNVIKSGSNSQATIICDLKEAGVLKVIVYDAKGREIIVLWDGHKDAGIHPFPWAGVSSGGSKVGSGVYMVHMKIGSYNKTGKIAVVK